MTQIMVLMAYFTGTDACGIVKHVQIANLSTVATCTDHIPYIGRLQALGIETLATHRK